jgi:hypothetical protein
MNPYVTLSSGIGTSEAASLRVRLTAWHDAMVSHERRLRAGRAPDLCNEECPHVEARALWAEAVAAFGTRAGELTFLRSRGMSSAPTGDLVTPAHVVSEVSNSVGRSTREVRTVPPEVRGRDIGGSSGGSHTTSAEL